RADVVITTGGLGPTVDDVTREGIAQAVGQELVLDEALLSQVRSRFEKWTMRMSDNNVRQAYIPRGATPVENPVGTAPAFLVEKDGHFIFTLPGVPREMKFLTESRVLPWLRQRAGGEEIILSKVLRTCAVGESVIDRKIQDLEGSANPTVGLAAHVGQTDVRITAKAKTRTEAEELIRQMEAQVRERLGDAIYGEGNEKLEEVVARMLAARSLKLALVESNTRGAIAERLRSTPEGGQVVASARVLERVDSIDEPAAQELADATRAESGASLGLAVLSTTEGNADMYGQETGRTAMAVSGSGGGKAASYSVGGTGELAQGWTLMRALDLVRRMLLSGRVS
ncbi:MAG: molybdopterin-binding protein, partial [Rudaea sp.]